MPFHFQDSLVCETLHNIHILRKMASVLLPTAVLPDDFNESKRQNVAQNPKGRFCIALHPDFEKKRSSITKTRHRVRPQPKKTWPYQAF